MTGSLAAGGPPVGVAIAGCGTISHQYLRNLASYPDVRVVACADVDADRAREVAAEYDVPVAGELATALAHPDVELVVNLTIPAAHVEVSTAAVRAGRHVYSEKPLALDPSGAEKLLAEAQTAGVLVGAAPDTFLGPAWQAVYRLLASGDTGAPLSAIALMQSPGPERWHPNPEFLFRPGAGPLFDMGPYYLTALAVAMGPVTRVSATARTGSPTRVIGSGPRAGTVFGVEVPTHVTAQMEYAGGQVATTVFSFDSPLGRQDFVEITGTEATLAAPNPNAFAGDVRLHRRGDQEWSTAETVEVSDGVGRGLGVLDLARAIRTGRPHRATGELALHVVDVMTAILTSAERAEYVPVHSTFPPPALLPTTWNPHEPQM